MLFNIFFDVCMRWFLHKCDVDGVDVEVTTEGDLEARKGTDGVKKVRFFMFADDVAVLAEDPEKLENQLPLSPLKT